MKKEPLLFPTKITGLYLKLMLHRSLKSQEAPRLEYDLFVS